MDEVELTKENLDEALGAVPTEPDVSFEDIMVAGVSELFKRAFFLEGVVAEVIGILAEDLAKQPHHAADRLRELIEVPEATEGGT